jgi:hypothetical protein
MTILFFVYFGTHINKIHTIYKPCFCFHFFHVVVLLLLANSNNKKSSFYIRSQYAMVGLWLWINVGSGDLLGELIRSKNRVADVRKENKKMRLNINEINAERMTERQNAEGLMIRDGV